MTVREVKVCLLGVSLQPDGCCHAPYHALYACVQDMGVGKTSLVGRFVNDTFSQNMTTTLG